MEQLTDNESYYRANEWNVYGWRCTVYIYESWFYSKYEVVNIYYIIIVKIYARFGCNFGTYNNNLGFFQ